MDNEELLLYLINEIDLIMHDKQYRFKNEDGTWYSRESCKDLTNEELFEELKCELRQLNSQVENQYRLETLNFVPSGSMSIKDTAEANANILKELEEYNINEIYKKRK